METLVHATDLDHCLGCLCSSKQNNLFEYKIQYAHFWTLFEVSTLKLCYVCRRVAQRAEQFIQNVHCSQTLLLNSVGELTSTVQEARTQLHPTISLTQTKLDSISYRKKLATIKKHSKTTKSCKSNTKKIDTKPEKIFICTTTNDNKITLNLAKEENDAEIKIKLEEGQVEEAFIDKNDGSQESFIKEENDLNNSITAAESDLMNDTKVEKKEEFEHVDESDDHYFRDDEDVYLKEFVKPSRKSNAKSSKKPPSVSKKRKAKDDPSKIKSLVRKESLSNDALSITKICLKNDEMFEERKQQAQDPGFLNRLFKCEDCIKGFNFKGAYHEHMKRHSESAGQYVCSVCKIRMDKRHKCLEHEKSHNVRWKCLLCGLVRASRNTMVDHHITVHRQSDQFACPYCPKTFKRRKTANIHVQYTHLKQERLTCDYCKKTFATKEVIESHMMTMHSKEILGFDQVKKFACEECGMMFRSIFNLKLHKNKHSTSRDFYCVECDKRFKSAYTLKEHLKTTQAHLSYSEYRLTCEQCKKRFADTRSLNRHIKATHLEAKRYQCDKCVKSYVSNSALRNHTLWVHEGHERPRRYPCDLCDKMFYSNTMLKAHIRTHTGERPYQCVMCPAQFSHNSALGTHNKLVHQKLSRNTGLNKMQEFTP